MYQAKKLSQNYIHESPLILAYSTQYINAILFDSQLTEEML